MEKVMGENEIKGLEEEIDSAVDRLFVEKKGGVPESQPRKTPVQEPSYKVEKDFEPETSIPPASTPPPSSRTIENMESQLLSLEWEITKENLGKTKEEVLALRETLEGKPDTISVLGLMEKVLDYMVKNEEKIRPPLVRFLLDSKETIKLLLKGETDNEVKTYKQLAYVGIQARYSCLEELKETKAERAGLSLKEETERAGVLAKRDKQMDEILGKMNLFLEKAEHLSRQFEQHTSMSRLGQGIQEPSVPLVKTKPLQMYLTIFMVGNKLFGVENEKVMKLFRVPSALQEKYSHQQTVRLRDFEVRLVDLKKIFPIKRGDPKEEMKILAVKGDGEHVGLMIDQVLGRLSDPSEIREAHGEYFLGAFHWSYQGRPTEILVLDLKKF